MRKYLLEILAVLALVLATAMLLNACASEVQDEDAVAVEADNEALSAAMTWPTLAQRGYDTLNALRCWSTQLGTVTSCQYGVNSSGVQCTGAYACSRCTTSGWLGTITTSTRVDPYTGQGYIWHNGAFATGVNLGPLLSGDVRTFTYDGGKYCRVFKSWGGTYAEFGP